MSNVVRDRSEPLLHRGRDLRHVPVWVAVLLLAIGLTGGTFVGRASKADPAPPPDLASASTSAWVRDVLAAVNSGDAARIRPFYADDATLTDIGNEFATPLKGGAHIAETFEASYSMLGAFLNEPSTVMERDQFVAYVGSWGDVKAGVVVFELDHEGKILNQWAIHPAQ